MNYNDKINKLADLFEYKLKKYAADLPGEVESGIVTLAVRPVVNAALKKVNFNANLNKFINGLVAKGATGNLIIKNIITNANLENGKWKINPSTSGLVIGGSLMNEAEIAAQINAYIARINQMLFKTLEAEFDRLTLGGSFKGYLITTHDVDIDKTEIG